MTSTPELRLAVPDDAAQILEIYRPFVAESAVSFELEPPTESEMARRIIALLPRLPWLVCLERETLLGYAYASPHRDRAAYQWTAEVSAYVRSDARRSGIARRLYQSLFTILAAQGYYNACAGITLPNEPSVRFHLDLGFQNVGTYHAVGFKFGRWHDVAWYERVLQSHRAPDRGPLPLSHPELAAPLQALLSKAD